MTSSIRDRKVKTSSLKDILCFPGEASTDSLISTSGKLLFLGNFRLLLPFSSPAYRNPEITHYAQKLLFPAFDL